jgi:NAD(P)H dehydrogenase (quinone)
MSLLKKTGKAMADIIPGLGRLTFDSDLGTIFVTSGTGVIGYRVAMSLLEAGFKNVKVGIWKGERQSGPGSSDESFADNIAQVLTKSGAEVVDFDWTDPKCYDEVLKDVKTIFCSLPHVEMWSEVFPAFLLKCREKKIEHFIKVSFLHNEKYRQNVPFCKFHSSCDDFVEVSSKSSRISYTILAASHLMSTPLLHQGTVLTEDHKYVTASYGMGINYVSPNDVADAAMVVLNDLQKHRNKVYNLTGAGPVTDRRVAKYLGKAYGAEIQHVELGYHDYVKDVKARGLPEWLVKDSAAFEKMKATGIDEDFNTYTKDLETLIGKTPETFEEYLANKDSQRPGKTFP